MGVKYLDVIVPPCKALDNNANFGKTLPFTLPMPISRAASNRISSIFFNKFLLVFKADAVSLPSISKSLALAITIGIETSRQVTSIPFIIVVLFPVGNSFPVVPPTIFLNFNKIGDPTPGTPAIL